MISRARIHLGPNSKPHLIHRLDRETSGLVVVAKNSTVAGELGKSLESRNVAKEYLAIVHGHVKEDSGVIDAPIGKDEQSEVAVKDCVRSDGMLSRTEFAVKRRLENAHGQFSLLRITPHTGRKHQIRIHLQYIGHPIVGDKLYGLDERFYLALVKGCLTDEDQRKLILPFQALHAAKLQFPFRGEEKNFRAEPEKWFVEFAQSH